MEKIRSVWRRRWATSAWVDSLLKDALLVAVFLVFDALAWLVLARTGGDGPRSGGMAVAAVIGGLKGGTAAAVIVLVMRTIRAAVSGRFLDEYRAERSARR